MSKLGGAGDNDDFRGQLKADRDSAKALCVKILQAINANKGHSTDPMHTQINNDFAKELNKYENITRELSKRDQQILQSLGGSGNKAAHGDYGTSGYAGDRETGYGDADDAPMMLSREQMEQVNIAQLRERQQAIVAVQRDVEEIHAMFTDLQTIVEKDGEVLDSIEERVATTYEQAAEALPALQEAEDYQKRARRKKCCMMMILVIVLSIIVIGVWQGLA